MNLKIVEDPPARVPFKTFFSCIVLLIPTAPIYKVNRAPTFGRMRTFLAKI